MIYEFLTPVNKETLLQNDELDPGQLGNYVFCYTGQEVELNGFNIALLGVCEDRQSTNNPGSARGPDVIRKELYRLFMPPVEKEFRVIDLGNIVQGDTPRDTYFCHGLGDASTAYAQDYTGNYWRQPRPYFRAIPRL